MPIESSEDELTCLEASPGNGKKFGDGVGVGVGGRRRKGVENYRKVSPFSSPRSVGTGRFFCEPRFEEDERPYFLDACALCKKSLDGNSDIFMYRGDTPFCSEECRQEQIDMDEAKEKNWNSRKEHKSNTADQSIHIRTTGAIVAG